MAALLAVIYQYLLSMRGYTSYLLDDNRNYPKPIGYIEKLIDENKEGVFSSFGYLAIYLGTQSIYYRISFILHDQYVNQLNTFILFKLF